MTESFGKIIKSVLILLVCFTGIFFAIINFVPNQKFENLKFTLGLDLQGGSDILLEVNFDEYLKEKISYSKETIARELRKEKIGYKNLISNNNSIQFTLRSSKDEKKIKSIIRQLDGLFIIKKISQDVFQATLTEASISKMKKQVKDQSIEVIRKRIDEKGNKEIILQPGSGDKIILQVPGVKDADEIANLLNVTAKLSFHLMDESTPFLSSKPNSVPLDSKVLTGYSNDNIYYIVKNISQIDGSSLVDANAIINGAEPAVSFSLDSIGAKRFAEITKSNTGKPFAIVLDNKVLSAPVIREPILGGSGVISGNFNINEAKDLALLLRSGALPASIKITQERIVGPSLGLDSMESGKKALILAVALVAVFMLLKYRIFGLFAMTALMINLTLIIAGLSILNSTLTLPGIAGIILTVGMSVDSNILIFERIKEFSKIINASSSKKMFIKSIEDGFQNSLSTILDSNITTIVTAIALYLVGFGPIKGFAVTLILGILTSMFSSIVLTGTMLKVFARLKKFKPLKA
jgi:preprotein translocase subunit SecD